jgi:nucleoid-associated protein YgaU
MSFSGQKEDARMKFKGNAITLSVVCLLLLAMSVGAFGQEDEKMKMDEYEAKLAEYQTQQEDVTQSIDGVQAEIDGLNQEINNTQGEIDKTWEEIYAMLGTDKAGVDAYRTELADIESEIDGLASLSAEELFKHKDDIKALEEKIAKARESNLSYLSEMDTKLAELDGKIAGLKSRLPANIYDEYTVVRGDYLWKIAKMEDIYGNPFQWIRIYNVNKDQIKDPDLIYPEQIFKIARGVGDNEYLVSKGDFLAKIAGMSKVFGDPTKWTKLYEANKAIVSDPSLIYPYQVLTIPAE